MTQIEEELLSIEKSIEEIRTQRTDIYSLIDSLEQMCKGLEMEREGLLRGLSALRKQTDKIDPTLKPLEDAVQKLREEDNL